MTADDRLLLILQFSCACFMTGVILFVQLVHYPLMKLADASRFQEFAHRHQQQTTWVVAGPMLLELLTAIWLAISSSVARESTLYVAAIVFLAIVWGSTGLLQMPLHRRLLTGYDSNSIHGLVLTNWIRTVAWSCRSLLLGAVLLKNLDPV